MAPRLLLALCLTGAALARTDLEGCTSFATVATPSGGGQPFGTVIWYVPGSGELCEFLDCGGGRAPPKTTVPGCDSYEGTETYSPNFINPKTLGQAPKTDVQTSADATVTAPAETSTEASRIEFSGSVFASASASGTGTAEDTAENTSASATDNLETMPTVIATDDATQESTLVLAPTDSPSGAKPTAGSQSSASGDDSSATGAASTSSAPSSVSTAGGAAPTAGGMLAFAAGAAVYAGLM